MLFPKNEICINIEGSFAKYSTDIVAIKFVKMKIVIVF